VTLILERVTGTDDPRLLNYCSEHGREHDSSFLPGVDFTLSADYPAYLLLEDLTAVGAVVLMRSSRYRVSQKGRFSILHSVPGSRQAYESLLGAIERHFQDLTSVYLFLPASRGETGNILTQLGFHIERYSFVLRRGNAASPQPEFPHGYSVQPLVPADEAGLRDFADCVNSAFSHQAGHTDLSVEEIPSWFLSKAYIDGGVCLLRKGREPVGTVCVNRDVEDSDAAEISALGILAGHRGRGLGRALLRHAISLSRGEGLPFAVLSVHAVNEAALRLYRSEGFDVRETMVCYALDCA
jgi:GNAT superfamily N-acetyltransferase